tara:strand:+ start:555 stop:1727 length:1173 start_codon:yes stop_codon:yes gene_type:complete
MAFKMRSGNKPGFKNMGSSPAKDMKTGSYEHSFESPAKQTKFPNSPKATERRKKKQKDFEPAYPGADYSKEDIAKMTEAEKIANIDGYEPKTESVLDSKDARLQKPLGPKKKTKSPAKQVKDNDLKEFLISERGFTPADADRMIKSGAYTKKDIKPGVKRKVIKKGPKKKSISVNDFDSTVPKPKKSTVSKHGQLSDAQKEYETDMKLYKKQSTGKGGYVKKKKKSPTKQKQQSSGKDRVWSEQYKKDFKKALDTSKEKLKAKKKLSAKDAVNMILKQGFTPTKGATYQKPSPAKQMPVKTKGLGPRTAFGGVKNPELTGTKKPFSRKVMKDDGGSDWKNRHAVKSDFQKKVEAKKKNWANMTPAQRKAAQDAANDKADKFHKRGKYKVK